MHIPYLHPNKLGVKIATIRPIIIKIMFGNKEGKSCLCIVAGLGDRRAGQTECESGVKWYERISKKPGCVMCARSLGGCVDLINTLIKAFKGIIIRWQGSKCGCHYCSIANSLVWHGMLSNNRQMMCQGSDCYHFSLPPSLVFHWLLWFK